MSFKEDGRLGNILMETATLILMAEKYNFTAKLLPQMAQKLFTLFANLPVSNPCHICLCYLILNL